MIRRLFFCAAFIFFTCGLVFSQSQVKTIYSFSASTGHKPLDKLIFDGAGNLYGTTYLGGEYGQGTIFELSPNGDGTWSETTLYNFCSDQNQYGGCLDGSQPESGLVADGAGTLYGVAPVGGMGIGVAYELSPPTQGGASWSYQVIYNFCTTQQCPDGGSPVARPIFDSEGNLYGTTTGAQSTVFELSPSSDGWSETTLYTFCVTGYPHCVSGDFPLASLTFDAAGNIYGTTSIGGSSKYEGGGVIFKLSPTSGGWNETTVASFQNIERGEGLQGAVNFDPEGNIYSTCYSGGAGHSFAGGVFRISVAKSAETFVSFLAADGNIGPTAGVLIDPQTRALYGTTSGDLDEEPGSIYEVSSKGVVTTLATGGNPRGALISDKYGNLYGTYSTGGQYGYGAVFEVTP
jgi:uncharacterized repeat protein (TIGR03803 family)